ncbi:hypothetical protein [Archangium lipolyticum]|uniref:hypothetical protein n=1 Tax=Archangium lipolyticum TaxID=2970465 RepID=UPI002149AB7B|nr:hypothetical protein [Archangium lipolyticum]
MRKPRLNDQQLHTFLESLFAEDLHAKRILSLSHAVLGVIHAASLGVHTIGKALTWARGTRSKHGVKQVDRLLSNQGIDVWALFALWVPYVLGQRSEALVALDWTDFDAEVASHGRTTPLVWLTVEKSALEGMRNDTEDFVLNRLREVVPEGCDSRCWPTGGLGPEILRPARAAEVRLCGALPPVHSSHDADRREEERGRVGARAGPYAI